MDGGGGGQGMREIEEGRWEGGRREIDTRDIWSEREEYIYAGE